MKPLTILGCNDSPASSPIRKQNSSPEFSSCSCAKHILLMHRHTEHQCPFFGIHAFVVCYPSTKGYLQAVNCSLSSRGFSASICICIGAGDGLSVVMLVVPYGISLEDPHLHVQCRASSKTLSSASDRDQILSMIHFIGNRTLQPPYPGNSSRQLSRIHPDTAWILV